MITRILQHKQIKSIRLQVSRITRKPALIIPILFISFVLKKVLPLHTALSLISVIVLLVYKNQKKLQNSKSIEMVPDHLEIFVPHNN